MGTLEGVSGCFQSFIISAKALNPEFWVAVGKERMAYPTDHIHRKAVLNKSSNFQNLKIMNTPPTPLHTHTYTQPKTLALVQVRVPQLQPSCHKHWYLDIKGKAAC